MGLRRWERGPGESLGLCPSDAQWLGKLCLPMRMASRGSLSCPGTRPEPGRPSCQTAARNPRGLPPPPPPVSVPLPSQPEKPVWPVASGLRADLLAQCPSTADTAPTHFLPRSPGPARAAPRPPGAGAPIPPGRRVGTLPPAAPVPTSFLCPGRTAGRDGGAAPLRKRLSPAFSSMRSRAGCLCPGASRCFRT